jgi:hypothetical protein
MEHKNLEVVKILGDTYRDYFQGNQEYNSEYKMPEKAFVIAHTLKEMDLKKWTRGSTSIKDLEKAFSCGAGFEEKYFKWKRLTYSNVRLKKPDFKKFFEEEILKQK